MANSIAELKKLIEKRNSIINDFNKKLEAANKTFEENGNGLIADVIDEKTLTVAIEIVWGDWKHDHAYADYVMKQNGFTKIYEEVTEEDGSDCASSIHYYHL